MDVNYFGLKAFHIVGVVVWFSGLFYLGRLLVYHREACLRPGGEARDALSEQLRVMAERLWVAITIPGLFITAIPGVWMILKTGTLSPWLHIKLTLVLLLIAYHCWCGLLVRRLRGDGLTWSSRNLRLFNEIPTLLLISIVFVAVMKEQVSVWWLLAAIVLLGLFIGGTVAIMAKRRAARSA